MGREIMHGMGAIGAGPRGVAGALRPLAGVVGDDAGCVTGGVAALNHRLLAVIPAGNAVDPDFLGGYVGYVGFAKTICTNQLTGLLQEFA